MGTEDPGHLRAGHHPYEVFELFQTHQKDVWSGCVRPPVQSGGSGGSVISGFAPVAAQADAVAQQDLPGLNSFAAWCWQENWAISNVELSFRAT